MIIKKTCWVEPVEKRQKKIKKFTIVRFVKFVKSINKNPVKGIVFPILLWFENEELASHAKIDHWHFGWDLIGE